MFNFLKKEKYLFSIADGSITNLNTVPDEVFSKKILGDGFAVLPSNGDFFSPADGTVTDVSDTLHAYCITSDDGLEILVHIGLDTVELKGKGFTPKVRKGQTVACGDLLAKVDLAAIEESGHSTISMVVITNTHDLKELNVLENTSASHGEKALSYKI
ncbi:MAG: PTS glucose transporter subunit IIA [Clostridia bacterium]|nr:PTS glucose transporter subunit IIA [Clostridia bacterium]MBQ9737734.1 PTS glucose transporter subunit IIA [Clostridia bacterium]